MTLPVPLVAAYGSRPLRRPVTTVATILDQPPAQHRPPRCRACRRLVTSGPLISGLGPRCARTAGLASRPRIPRPRGVEHQGPDLLDLLAEHEAARQARDHG